MSYTGFVRAGASPLGALREVNRWGRRTGVHRVALLSQYYEKPTTRRNRIAEERAYAAKRSYLKYAAEMIKYSINNHLLLPCPSDALDEQRLPSLAPKPFLSAEESIQRLQEVDAQLRDTEATIKLMDTHSPLTAAERSTSSSRFVSASRVLSEVHHAVGSVPSLASLKRRLQTRGWIPGEVNALWIQLRVYTDLVLERQRLRDSIAAAEGRAAKWSQGYSEAETAKIAQFARRDTK
ncbi:hypothetical protein cyc_05367 [Cyclospora cayetanensis]|uniref:Uncharacterized protein n=1 Tax=Cyclospora cayetanensis TaxID=88456 RepID=A0A1D3D379_9EIME|nr:hypothetical protein cyc_05367 [Cyclospora cayetanensis]